MSDNKNIVLIMGKPNSGKSHSLMYLEEPDTAVYLNTDRKELPFPSKFKHSKNINQPYDIITILNEIEAHSSIKTVVVDTLTFLMDMFETQVLPTYKNTQQGWGDYAKFYQTVINIIKNSEKNFIILAHEAEKYNDSDEVNEICVPVKGSIGRRGVEADFSNVLQAKSIKIAEAEKHPNDKLTITDYEREDGIKKVFVTRVTKDNLGHKIRSSWNLWKREELYIDNNLNTVIKTIKDYYK